MVLFPDQSQVSLRTPEYAKAVDSVCLILLLICSIIKDKKESIFCYFFSLKLTYIFSPSEGALPVGRKREGFLLLLRRYSHLLVGQGGGGEQMEPQISNIIAQDRIRAPCTVTGQCSLHWVEPCPPMSLPESQK